MSTDTRRRLAGTLETLGHGTAVAGGLMVLLPAVLATAGELAWAYAAAASGLTGAAAAFAVALGAAFLTPTRKRAVR